MKMKNKLNHKFVFPFYEVLVKNVKINFNLQKLKTNIKINFFIVVKNIKS